MVAAVPLTGSGGAATTGDFTVPNLPGGSYNLLARFPGDSTFAGSVSNPIAVNITPEVSTTTMNLGVTSWPYGHDFGFNATVTGPSGQGIPTGAITFFDNGNVLGKVPLSNIGIAYFQWCPPPNISQSFPNLPPIPCPFVGKHVYSATYSGDTSFTASPTPPAVSQSATVDITPSQPYGGIDFTSPNPNWTMNEPMTATAVVESGSQSAIPTGTVQFFLGATALSQPVPLTGNPAQAAISNLQFPQGANAVTAAYSGDSNYQATTYSTTLNWGVPVGWTASSTVATVNPGQTATYKLNLSASGFSGTAQIVCVPGLDVFHETPTIIGAQCTVSPETVNVTSGGAAVPIVVTITTTLESRLSPPQMHTLPFALPPALAFGLWFWRKRRWRALLGCVLAALALSMISSCGGAPNLGTTSPPPPPATSGYFSVWASTAVSSSDTAYTGAKLTLNVNP